MTPCPMNCSFSYMSVIPPTHCPYCGRCLGCGGPQPVYPRPVPTYPAPWPRPCGPTWTSPTITITRTHT